MPVYGWDCSNFDWSRGPMDFAAAAAAGIQFVTHKAAEGASTVHDKFGEAMRRANAAGIPILGAYHVVRTGPTTASQVSHLLATCDRLWPAWRTHPYFLFQVDLEKWPYDAVPAVKGIDFGKALAAKVPNRIVMYASKGQYGNELAGCPFELWNASYGSNLKVPFAAGYPGDSSSRWAAYSGKVPVFLQYGSNTIIGRQSTCDANAYRGSLTQLKTFIGGAAATTTSTSIPDEGDLDMGTAENLDEANWRGGTSMGPPVPDQFRVEKLPDLPEAPAGVRYGNSHNDRLYATQKLAEQVARDVAELKARPTGAVVMSASDRDAMVAGLVSGLAVDGGFLAAVAKAVADETAQRQQD